MSKRQGQGQGFGRPGGWQQADLPVADDAAAWVRGRMPDGWFVEPIEVSVDREEIVIMGRIDAPLASRLAAAESTPAAAPAPVVEPTPVVTTTEPATSESDAWPDDEAAGQPDEADAGVDLGKDTDPAPVTDQAPAAGTSTPIAAEESGRIARFREDTRGVRMQIARQVEERYGRRVAWGARCGGTSELFTNISVPVMTRLRQPERQVLDTLVDAGVARSRSEALAWCVKLVGQHTDDWLRDLRTAMSQVDRLRSEGPTV